MVNRVWQHHFGRGLVGTPNDFGVMGDDADAPGIARLAGRPLRHGRLVAEEAAPADRAVEHVPDIGGPGRRRCRQGDKRLALSAGGGSRRLEAEAVRDAVLAVSGRLNSEHGGPQPSSRRCRGRCWKVSRGPATAGPSTARGVAAQRLRLLQAVAARAGIAAARLAGHHVSCEQRRRFDDGAAGADVPQRRIPERAGRLLRRPGCGGGRRRRGGAGAAGVRRLASCRPARPDESGEGDCLPGAQRRQIQKDAERRTASRVGEDELLRSRALAVVLPGVAEHERICVVGLKEISPRRTRRTQRQDWKVMNDLRAAGRGASSCGRPAAASPGRPLTAMLLEDGFFAGRAPRRRPAADPLAPKPPHFPARAKSVICLFMYGGVSQVDTFDPKPELTKRQRPADPQPRRRARSSRRRNPGKLLASPRKFAKHGQVRHRGLRSRIPHLAECVDDLAVIRATLRRQLRARLGPVADEHRLFAAGPPVARLLGDAMAWAR